MIRRLFYHATWSFYDHLGTLILIGLAHMIVSLGILVTGLELFGSNGYGTYMAIGGAEIAFTALVTAGLFHYSALAAQDKPARLRHIIAGITRYWRHVSGFMVGFFVVAVILTANLRFYGMFNRHASSEILQYIALVIAAMTGWFMVLLWLMLAPALAVITYGTPKLGLKGSLRRVVMVVVLNPLLWIAVAIIGALLLGFGVWSRAGLLLFLPALAVLTQTAFWLSIQFESFLAQAKAVSADVSLRELKRQAHELATDWELRQPRRTIKELLKPWEY